MEQVLAPLRIVLAMDALRAEHDQQILLHMLVVGFQRIVAAKSLDPVAVDLNLIQVVIVIGLNFLTVLVVSTVVLVVILLLLLVISVISVVLRIVRFIFVLVSR